MKIVRYIQLLLLLAVLNSVHGQKVSYSSYKSESSPVIDGITDEPCWSKADWGYINNEWFGLIMPDSSDFYGRYKATWTSDKLFLLVEITDDYLIDDIEDPLDQYWEDDCLEIFIDEDNSGGDHKCCESAYNAFAYHTSPVTYDAVDLSSGGDFVPLLFNDHLEMEVRSNGNVHTIEMAIEIYGDNYDDAKEDNTTVNLVEGKIMGFSLAYCDDDGNGRENFIGTQPGGLDSWMNADLFGSIELVSDLTDVKTVSSGFRLFPVPADEIVYLKNDTDNPFSYRIYNTTGILLDSGCEESIHTQISFDTSILEQGIYYLLIDQSYNLSRLRFEIIR
ncbi:MAG: hypothetical protein IH594_13655 [Bacteroidales bacterium]|nr:hypothetical protein [Bacteroidales bacterium]